MQETDSVRKLRLDLSRAVDEFEKTAVLFVDSLSLDYVDSGVHDDDGLMVRKIGKLHLDLRDE